MLVVVAMKHLLEVAGSSKEESAVWSVIAKLTAAVQLCREPE